MICANCRIDLFNATCTGVSGLYNPGPLSFLLCEDCWLDEEDLIDETGKTIIRLELLLMLLINLKGLTDDQVTHRQMLPERPQGVSREIRGWT